MTHKNTSPIVGHEKWSYSKITDGKFWRNSGCPLKIVEAGNVWRLRTRRVWETFLQDPWKDLESDGGDRRGADMIKGSKGSGDPVQLTHSTFPLSPKAGRLSRLRLLEKGSNAWLPLDGCVSCGTLCHMKFNQPLPILVWPRNPSVSSPQILPKKNRPSLIRNQRSSRF